MSKTYDAIVIGVGGMGSAALFQLAKRGARVLGIDLYPPGEHENGSSHGEARVIRLAYFEHPDYVPLLRRAYQLWDALEAEWGEPLFHRVGVLQVGPPDGEVIPGLLRAAAAHQLALDALDRQALAERFPGFQLPEGHSALFERDAGILRVEACVRAHAKRAQAHGAELRIGARASDPVWEGQSFSLTVGGERLEAAKVVCCPGAWAPAGLGKDLNLNLSILKKPSFWFGPPDPRFLLEHKGPAFLYETPAGIYYGLPAVSPRGVKVAEHTGGEVLALPLPAVGEGRPEPTAEEEARVRRFVSTHLKGVPDSVQHRALCMYTMTPDQHFILDRHPRRPELIMAAGFSGHGFKFASVVGEVLADLALDGRTQHPIGFLGIDRLLH